jgi:hypothetical protein
MAEVLDRIGLEDLRLLSHALEVVLSAALDEKPVAALE